MHIFRTALLSLSLIGCVATFAHSSDQTSDLVSRLPSVSHVTTTYRLSSDIMHSDFDPLIHKCNEMFINFCKSGAHHTQQSLEQQKQERDYLNQRLNAMHTEFKSGDRHMLITYINDRIEGGAYYQIIDTDLWITGLWYDRTSHKSEDEILFIFKTFLKTFTSDDYFSDIHCIFTPIMNKNSETERLTNVGFQKDSTISIPDSLLQRKPPHMSVEDLMKTMTFLRFDIPKSLGS